MHEDLLGYLLGALEPHEMRRVAEMLRNDADVRAELDRIEKALLPLEEDYEPTEPPPADLVARTLAALPPLPSPEDLVAQDSVTPTHAVTLAPMHSGVEPPSTSTLSWLDWVSGSVAVAVLLGLLLPALAQGRFESRKIACQDQLREFGTALTRFVTRNQQERLPACTEEGPEAFAGIYAVRLYDAGLLPDPSQRWCPSMNMPEFSDPENTNQPSQPVGIDTVVTAQQLHRATVNQLKQLQRWLGGHYAYTLGVIDHGGYASPQFKSRSSFAIMSDAPMSRITDGVPGGRVGHSGEGINVLFEDGRVQFITLSSLDSMPDHPLLNHKGKVEAGVNVDDASLAPSWRAPFPNVRQR